MVQRSGSGSASTRRHGLMSSGDFIDSALEGFEGIVEEGNVKDLKESSAEICEVCNFLKCPLS